MQFSYTVKGLTETQKTKDEVKQDLYQACIEATDDGLYEVLEVMVEEVSNGEE